MSARENILNKLKKADAYPMMEPNTDGYYAQHEMTWPDDISRLKHWAAAMRGVKTEIFWVTEETWPQVMRQVAQQKGLKNMLLPLDTPHGQKAKQALADTAIAPLGFDRVIDEWKDELFAEVEAGFTASQCGIARTGTIMLFSNPEEPRSLSLVPPVHFCLFDAGKMYNEFHHAVAGEKLLENGMPTNVILISGPSKTADIQLTLAYGAHGPRDLVVLAVLPPHITPADLEENA
ncbi:LutC/YkgG family protein [Neisseria perflava]|uniref:LutC/YkgG family protein n=1 Tax=Neisseria perflava TaxID=33053 RepID=UPI00209E06FD|nr:lactate utilization protein C [Neisseria perflava]MCP1660697.1 L-lactate dehydrogenase complex protein LldG [Neisseria perflava]MCP1773074.1 L-lactate dehydrogenase complex protein LldG [Neisseria perflava]